MPDTSDEAPNAAAAPANAEQPRQDGPAAPAHAARIDVADWALYLLTRLAFVSVTRAEVAARAYPPSGRVPAHDVNPGQAEFLYKLHREDSAHTDDKVKQLLTLSSSLATFILVFTRDVQPRWLLAVVLALLVACVYLCASVFEVRTDHAPTPEDAAKDGNGRQWARDLLASYFANRGRHAFRVDRYRAAGRYFWTALLMTPIIVLFSAPKPDAVVQLRDAVVRAEQALTTLTSRMDSLARQGVPVRVIQPVNVRSAAPAPPIGGARAHESTRGTTRRPGAR